MGRGQRLALILAAIAVAAGAFVVLSPGDDDEDGSPAQNSAGTTATQTAEQPPPAAPEPVTAKLAVSHEGVEGGMKTIKAKKDDEVRIDVQSEIDEELHLHGYDIKKTVAAGGTARFRLTADLEGVFELEAHHLGDVVIAELVVEP